MLDVAALLDNLKKSLQVALTQQLRQPAFSLGLAQAQFPPDLLADVEEAFVIESLLARDPNEPGDDGGFRFLVRHYEIEAFRGVVSHRSASCGQVLFRLWAVLR